MRIALRALGRVATGIGGFAVALLLYAVTCFATASVEVITCQASSQGAHIALDLNGVPAKTVKVTLATLKNRPIRKLPVGKTGLVVLPPLAPGQYFVSAIAPKNLGGTICVELKDGSSQHDSSFRLALNPLPPKEWTVAQMLTEAESKAPTEKVQSFKGEVVDPAGATVPGTSVQIFPKGVRKDSRSIRTTTDANGKFKARLSEGIYTALFMRAGFQTRISRVEISGDGAEKDLRIVLNLGAITE